MSRKPKRDPVEVLSWLVANPVPAGPSPEWTRWRSRAERLGSGAVPTLVHALEFAPPDVQYTAQQGLRVLGVEVWAHGYGRDLEYSIHVPGKPARRIRPLVHDASPIEAIAGTTSGVEEDSPAYGSDPYALIEDAGRAIEAQREQMAKLARIRSQAVRELLDSGVSRSAIARRLGVHPNYVNQLAGPVKDTGRKRRKDWVARTP